MTYISSFYGGATPNNDNVDDVDRANLVPEAERIDRVTAGPAEAAPPAAAGCLDPTDQWTVGGALWRWRAYDLAGRPDDLVRARAVFATRILPGTSIRKVQAVVDHSGSQCRTEDPYVLFGHERFGDEAGTRKGPRFFLTRSQPGSNQ